MKVHEERGNLIKEQMRKYDNPNKARTYVEKNLDPALAIQILQNKEIILKVVFSSFCKKQVSLLATLWGIAQNGFFVSDRV